MDKSKNWDVNDPEVRQLVEGMKMELAREYGMQIPLDGYWGHCASKELGKIGSQLKKRLPILLERGKKEKNVRKKRK
ncbi:small acid-soluble spore protein alpha/beta type [Tumebacillus sp. BK434]|uniref:small, acid-soluble spore protein, alpha/beta type n=1 Tax=Tumebacillus sp. BK434 TaxID=2512169 RepID=UPI00104CB0C7|nr:small, acid-soluble spore protein, alpha/beta type [Tumebacillus sp. BK434]TCP57639.1 small acid-soluble spore protein alpha/beta type [Tumebacillus sp. BK434]